MPGSSFGHLFRITTAGESHGPGNVVIIDGVPPLIPFCAEDVHRELKRRRPGQNAYTSPRQESDEPQILSGVFAGKTTGASVAILVANNDQRSADYEILKDSYRPGHADLTYEQKFGIRDYRGGGRASARETVARVCAGALAGKILAQENIEILGFVRQIGHITSSLQSVSKDQIENSPIRCPDPEKSLEMQALISQVKAEGDSIGGIAEFIIRGVPPGLGEPVFDKLKADFAKALLSIPGVTGFEYGLGFSAVTLKGSEYNDNFISANNQLRPFSNRQGGMHGGISNGSEILLRASVRPAASIAKQQETYDRELKKIALDIGGRHDPCLLPRFIPVGEAMLQIVLVDHLLRQRAICGTTSRT